MKRLIGFLLIGICLITNAFAAAREEYTERSCSCNEISCVCFMQLGDEGAPVKAVIAALKEKGYLADKIDATYIALVVEAVQNLQREYGLEETGMMDDETLTYLLWGMSSAELDVAMPELPVEIVWVPTDGGKKYHKKPNCSGMYDPRKMTRRNAEALGIEGCRKGSCYRNDR